MGSFATVELDCKIGIVVYMYGVNNNMYAKLNPHSSSLISVTNYCWWYQHSSHQLSMPPTCVNVMIFSAPIATICPSLLPSVSPISQSRAISVTNVPISCHQCHQCPSLVPSVSPMSQSPVISVTNVPISCHQCHQCPSLVPSVSPMSQSPAISVTNVPVSCHQCLQCPSLLSSVYPMS